MARIQTRIVGAVLLLLSVAACTTPPTSAVATAYHGSIGYEEVGIASWYGQRYHGRQTASGERFDMHALTAAHPSLPFGTRVRVENLENGRSVVLRINDRGPFVAGRIIDVSKHAAERLGFERKGVVRVRVRVI